MESESTVPLQVLHNGELRRASEAVLGITDGAIVRGAGIFETLAVYDGTPFCVTEHLARLREGAETLGLALPSESELNSAMVQILEANHLSSAEKARIRITVSAGSPNGKTPNWFVEASLPPAHPETARVITVPFVRNDRGALAGCKTINYGENVVALNLAQTAEADEALFGNTHDHLCEGTWSNVFVRHEGQWKTPPLSSGCLPGVTRSLVLKLAPAFASSIEETAIPMTELTQVDAAFLTSSLRELQPISAINGRPLGSASLPEIEDWKKAFREITHPKGQ